MAEIFGLTDRGQKREKNEDQFLVGHLDADGLDVVLSSIPGRETASPSTYQTT